VKPPSWALADLFRGATLISVLDGLQDPGNAGAVVRSAEAFGATGVVFLKGTVSPHNPKTLRASAGSLFRVPFLDGLTAELLCTAFEQNGLEMYAAVAHREGISKPLGEVDLTRKSAIVFGSEGRGVSPAVRAAAEELSIPTVKVESLNAAVAAGIVLYEAWRQRRLNE
jgi:TrmH family RNA methyltransferase